MNTNRSKEEQVCHTVRIDARERLLLTGIKDILAFDENSVVLKASGDMGVISIEGEQLRIDEMSAQKGDILIEGRINGFVYIDKDRESGKKQGLFGKRK